VPRAYNMHKDAVLVDRLNFSLPPFVRQQWASEVSRTRWQPQIAAARKAYQNLEVASVAQGVRRAARKIISPERMEAVANEVAPLGLTLTPIAIIKSFRIVRVTVQG